MGRVVARSVAQVVAGEAVSGTRAQRYADMKAIASVIDNRAKALGVTPQQVVSDPKEFNAYGKALPAGVSSYVGMAEKALQDVSVNGPVHSATFYSTPEAAKNLPKGLKPEAETTGHRYFSDPKARAIGTAVGYKTPDLSMIGSVAMAAAPANVPSPTFASRAVGGLLAQSAPSAMGLAPTPAPSRAMAAINSALSPAQEANLAGRLGATPLSAAQDANLASRLGPATTKTALNAAQEQNLADRLGVAVNKPAATKTALSPAQDANLASRLGDMDAAKAANVAGRLDAAQSPAPSMSLGGLLGVNSASAGTLTSAPSRPTAAAPAAPASTGFAGPIGSPRSMEATIAGPSFGARYASAPSTPTASVAAAPSPAPTTNFAGAAAMSPRAAEEQSMSSLNTQDALNAGMFSRPAPATAAPAMSPEAALTADVADQRKAMGLPALSAPRTVAAAPATYSAPMAEEEAPASAYASSYAPEARQSIAGAVGQSRQATGLGLPGIPDAPTPGLFGGFASNLNANKGKLAGGLLGTALAGPVGGLVGGLLGAATQRGMTAQPSKALQNAAPGLGFDGFSYGGPGSISLGDLGYGVGIGGISIRSDGSTGLGAPGIPGAPTGRASYSSSGNGSEGASKSARDNAGQGKGLY